VMLKGCWISGHHESKNDLHFLILQIPILALTLTAHRYVMHCPIHLCPQGRGSCSHFTHQEHRASGKGSICQQVAKTMKSRTA
jgi:hypothetical protein